MKSLVVGMGFGNLYKEVLLSLGAEVVTVDIDPSKADYTTVEEAVEKNGRFTTAHICTPNFTHSELAARMAPVSDIVFVDKPGFETSLEWGQFYHMFQQTRIMMVKNNMWRDNISEMKKLATQSVGVSLFWINENRVPAPGSWFTTKSKAFGGVSRDLMPHLLSLYIALNPNYDKSTIINEYAKQRYTLNDIKDSNYGMVDLNGTYNVDDLCGFTFRGAKDWILIADWRNKIQDIRAISFDLGAGRYERVELGLCPVSAYKAMILDAVNNIDNDNWWKLQYEYDMWIHQKIEKL